MTSTTSLADHLAGLSPGRVRTDVPLSTLGTWRIGGPADAVIEPQSLEELQMVLTVLTEEDCPFVVIGAGSNILFDDSGVRGAVIRLGAGFSQLEIEPTGAVRAGAALWVPRFVRSVTNAGFGGCEHAIGIPGSLGGLVVMNGGSMGKAIGDKLRQVTVVDPTGAVRHLGKDECGFGYRGSNLRQAGSIVVEASFSYEPVDPDEARRTMLGLLRDRRRKFPRKTPNCGSVFLSDPDHYALVGAPGKAIESAGLKGRSCGGAEVTTLHANFIANTGKATSADVLQLIKEVREAVQAHSGVLMRSEVLYLSPEAELMPATEAIDRLEKRAGSGPSLEVRGS